MASMNGMGNVIKEAEKFALAEISKHGLPSLINFITSNEKGLKLAKKFKANKDIVAIGTRLMDIKLGEASAMGKDHLEMGVAAAREFLSHYTLDTGTKEKIINCVEAHHRTAPWKCKEAEIVANADCYRFLLPKNWLIFLHSLGARGMDFEQSLNYAESKAEEKWKILSLSSCKKELAPNYELIKEITKRVRQ